VRRRPAAAFNRRGEAAPRSSFAACDDDDSSRHHVPNGSAKFIQSLLKSWQSRVSCREHDYTDGVTGNILLVPETLIRCNEYLESRGADPQQVSVLCRRPTLFLNGADFELRKIPP
jgi:hypothetical protein